MSWFLDQYCVFITVVGEAAVGYAFKVWYDKAAADAARCGWMWVSFCAISVPSSFDRLIYTLFAMNFFIGTTNAHVKPA